MVNSPGVHIHTCIDELEQELQQLDELPPETTPETTERCKNLITEIQRQINQISSMEILLQAPNCQHGRSGGEVVKAQVNKLLVLFDAKKYLPLTAKDFAKTSVFLDSGSRETIKDLMYECLLHKYKDTYENWCAAIVLLVESRNGWVNICDKTNEIQKLDNDMDHLVAMNKFSAAILMDLSWDVTDKERKICQSSVFDKMLAYLCHHLLEENFVHVPAMQYESVQHVEDFLDMILDAKRQKKRQRATDYWIWLAMKEGQVLVKGCIGEKPSWFLAELPHAMSSFAGRCQGQQQSATKHQVKGSIVVAMKM
ncbi:hypothetical protein IW261DRAFT_1427715 [Armillaria novae-zelandiae]|uniref:Uncharacterized protein n=1 Tax=Armillaria novae-zelandiae TaxID=153914 RepID=A0AA39TLM5_9AGAR|nr:hypothetical protein IW261DRAFT_1427715 [Armillaria novae-zelandiae]